MLKRMQAIFLRLYRGFDRTDHINWIHTPELCKIVLSREATLSLCFGYSSNHDYKKSGTVTIFLFFPSLSHHD